jgi:hypothetical protein
VCFVYYLQIEVLPEIVDAVQGRLEVYVDGGVRLGTDVFKALALGARAVFIGRPVIMGLAYQVKISGITECGGLSCSFSFHFFLSFIICYQHFIFTFQARATYIYSAV